MGISKRLVRSPDKLHPVLLPNNVSSDKVLEIFTQQTLAGVLGMRLMQKQWLLVTFYNFGFCKQAQISVLS
jgi:hypothetical protein